MNDYSVTWTLEWLNSNMHRNYPLADSAVPRAEDEQYLPSSFLTDLQLVVPYVEGVDPSRFFISSVVRNVDSFQVTIGYMTVDPTVDDTIAGFDCAVSASIPMNMEYTGQLAHGIEVTAITTVPADVSGSYKYGIPSQYAAMRGIRGTLYIGSCRDMQGIGAMQFTWRNTAIIPTCIYVEQPKSELQSIRVVDDYGTDATFAEDLTLRASEGIKLEYDNGVLTCTISDTFIQDKITAFMQEHFGSAVTSINGKFPDAVGNFTITGLDCTQIAQTEHGITISNPCAKPCCDQDGQNTAQILATLEQIDAEKTVLNNYYTDLATKINSMQSRLASLIASRR